MKKARCLFALLLFLFPSTVTAEGMEEIVQRALSKNITIDLREPVYAAGILVTERGGVITAPEMRIQAQSLCYTYRPHEIPSVWSLVASDDLLVEFGCYRFTGKTLVYDFQTKEGVLIEGRSMIEPWHFGGKQLELRSDGTILLYEGYMTTSERDPPIWGIRAACMEMGPDRHIKAQQVFFQAARHTLFWLPSLRMHVDSILDHPIRYRFRWGGRQGPRIGLTYEVFAWKEWKTFFRFDYRLTRGPGGGVETRYRSLDRMTECETVSYLAKDSPIIHRNEKNRYRFEGRFRKIMHEGKTELSGSYDKISDREMPANYRDHDFDFDLSEPTELCLIRKEEWGILQGYARVRLNQFQTIKEELPTLSFHVKPIIFSQIKMIWENQGSCSFLNFKYSKSLTHAHSYHSPRIEYAPALYFPLKCKWLTLTPRLEGHTIFYGNSPTRVGHLLLIGRGSVSMRSHLYRRYRNHKHVMIPYLNYEYDSAPTASPSQHFIFDIADGWTFLHRLSFGCSNIFYSKKENGEINRPFSLDLYADAFFNMHTIKRSIPRIYGLLHWFPLPIMYHTIDMGWNLERADWDHLAFRSEWTISEACALSLEYRFRDPFCWRKLDRNNFFVDAFHSEERLRHSLLSDQRKTLLLRFFYTFYPNWSLKVSTRQGWHRLHEPRYLEYEVELLTAIQTAWHLRFSFQHQEDENRAAVYLTIGLPSSS